MNNLRDTRHLDYRKKVAKHITKGTVNDEG